MGFGRQNYYGSLDDAEKRRGIGSNPNAALGTGACLARFHLIKNFPKFSYRTIDRRPASFSSGIIVSIVPTMVRVVESVLSPLYTSDLISDQKK
ncbi:hypothetical protein PENSUB_321 [Penicillium subrubescens]|uniref:Uncharacterized protein n=1 Tax=Penicillium subrubescens TaxID=1316194 RepID=A0A1Q5UNK4_9EURO|nr:hypothetical protein PENSUB_321 [Penicillium subrubescens]